jgi:hypothetical protein
MRKLLVTLAVLLLPALAASQNLSTGTAPWTVVEQNGYNLGATGTASVVTPTDADWYGGWVANSPSSSWIAYDPANCCDNGLGDYSTTFVLTSGNISSAALSGSWTLDDSGELLLNGNVIATLGNGNWGLLNSFTVPNSDFIVGTNTLEIDITSTDSYLEGVNLEGTLTTVTPEPTSLLLFGSGVLGLVVCCRKRLA